MELLTAAQMRAIEQAAIESGEVTGLELMERAGRGVVEAIFEWRPELAAAPGRAVVLCGPGNNGGDGFVVARRLKDKGWEVEVFLYGDEAKLPPDAAENCRRWRELGEVSPLIPAEMGSENRPDIIVDAVLGIGLTRPAPLEIGEAVKAITDRGRGQRFGPKAEVVAIDVPSGLCADSGVILSPDAPDFETMEPEEALIAHRSWMQTYEARRFRTDLTVTFHSEKVGHFLESGPARCRKLVKVGIKLPHKSGSDDLFFPREADRTLLVDPMRNGSPNDAKRWARRMIPATRAGHKYQRGHVLVLSGGPGKGGAARLAARAALRVGAGLATIGCPEEAIAEHAAQLNAIMLRPISCAASLDEMLQDDRLSSICLGPGLGIGKMTRDLVAAATRKPKDYEADDDAFRRFVVIDADGLSSFEEDPDALFALTHQNCALTPHEGEFARLFPDLSERARTNMRLSKLDAAKEAADRAGCIVVLKGPDTVIASPGGIASIHSAQYGREANWLGTAGSGDVLAGLIAGLQATFRIADERQMATELAVWLHVEAAIEFGPGLIAEDLPETLPKVFRKLGL